jgi:hypothetical protein
MALFSPILFLCISRYALFSIGILLLLWLSDVYWPSEGQSFLSVFIPRKIDTIFFFLLGGYCGFKRYSFSGLLTCNTRLKKQIIICWLCIVFLNTVGLCFFHAPDWLYRLIQKISILFGMVAMCQACDLFPATIQDWILQIGKFTFFIYLTHEPSLIIVKKIIMILYTKPSYSNLVAYLAAPVVTITIILISGAVLQKKVPKLYALLSGGRG